MRPGRTNDAALLEAHFRFGRNWRSYAAGISEEDIESAVAGLSRLVPDEGLAGKRFLDVGCGAGLSMLAAQRLGASSAHGIDIDSESVEAAREVLSKYSHDGTWSVETASILETGPVALGRFDIVHSWGVLHHSGRMWEALERASELVERDGLLIVALYRRTPFCRLWKAEKRFYAHASGTVQAIIHAIYRAVFFAGLIAKRRRPSRYIAHYSSARGMDWYHDVHDWLGGYPYESTSPHEVAEKLAALGFRLETVREVTPPLRGLFGSACDEYVARRTSGVKEDMIASHRLA